MSHRRLLAPRLRALGTYLDLFQTHMSRDVDIGSIFDCKSDGLPLFNPGNPVYLHGRHCLEAARRFLVKDQQSESDRRP